MYCPNCCVLVNGTRCPVCGSKQVRESNNDDYCFLVEKELIWATALEDLLTDNGIPFVTRNALGAGLAAKIGPALERKRFFVPFQHYTRAKELEMEFFSVEFEFEE